MSLFEMGMLVQTAGIHQERVNNEEFDEFLMNCLSRHQTGDWGDLCKDDAEINDEAIKAEQEGKPTDQIFSSYKWNESTSVWIITEWDRSVTTILFPEDY